MTRRPLIAIAAIALASLAHISYGATVNIGASRDASIFQNNPNNASGGGNALTSGTNGNGSPRRALIGFDVAANLPAGAVVQSVQLNLVLGAVAGGGGAGGGPASVTIGLHELQANWGEGITQQQNPASDALGGQGQGLAAANGDVTWNSNFNGSSLWATPGGVFAAATSASAAVGTSLDATLSFLTTPNLVSDVQGWFDNPASNFGWELVNTDEGTANTGRTFYSSEVLTAAFHPELVITYGVVPEPSGVALVVVGAAASVITSGRAKARRTIC